MERTKSKTDLCGFREGAQIGERKDKKIYSVVMGGTIAIKNLVIVGRKSEISDSESSTRKSAETATYDSQVTRNVCELLKHHGILMDYIDPVLNSKTKFFAEKIKIFPIEVEVIRYVTRESTESERNPYLLRSEHDSTYHFKEPAVRFFLETADGKLLNSRGEKILELDLPEGENSCHILSPQEESWLLCKKRKSFIDPESGLGCILAEDVYEAEDFSRAKIITAKIEAIARKSFLILEWAFKRQGFLLIDLKMEFGTTPDGEIILVAIDSPAINIRSKSWQKIEEQNLPEDLAEINPSEKRSLLMARLTQNFEFD